MATSRERIDELLINEATGGLSAAEAQELEALLSADAAVDRYGFERAATACFLAATASPLQAMPESLRDRLQQTLSQATQEPPKS